MCLCPSTIPNPWYGKNRVARYAKTAWRHDCESARIYIPCGVCRECVALKQMYLVQRVQMESLDSFLFFTTLTYDDVHLPHYICDNGYSIPFADTQHLQLLFKRLRNDNAFGRPFRYLAVSERGSKRGRPHFHILWFLPKYQNESFADALFLETRLSRVIRDAWCVNLGSKRVPKYVPLFTYHEKYVDGKLRTNYDTHFVRPSLTADGVSSVAFYVCKYMLKGSNKERRLQQALRLNLTPEEYDIVFGIVKSKTLRSSSFGLGFPENTSGIISRLKKGIQLSKASSKFPMFYAPDSQKTFPLCPYYRMRGDIFTERDWLDFHMSDPSVFMDFDKTVTECKNGDSVLSKQISLMELHDLSLDF